MHIDKLKHVVLALVGRGEMGCVSESGGKTMDNKERSDEERVATEGSSQHGRLEGDRREGDNR